MKKSIPKVIILFYILLTSCFSSAQGFEWAKSMGGTNSDIGHSIAIDSSNNIYTLGNFTGTVDFDPGPGTSNLTSNGNTNAFIQKLDPSGNFIWAKAVGTLGSVSGNFIQLDNLGNIYIGGDFSGTVDFDPGPGINNLISNGNTSAFIQKLDPSGNFIWAKAISGFSSTSCIYIDTAGFIFTAGTFQDTAVFDSGSGADTLVSYGPQTWIGQTIPVPFPDVFFQKLDANGNFIWVKKYGDPYGDNISSISRDVHGDFYIGGAGYYAPFYPNSFVLKVNEDGTLIWKKAMGSSYGSQSSSVIDANGNIYTLGTYANHAGENDFNPSIGGVFSFPESGDGVTYPNDDIFIQKMDSMGNFLWAKSIGASGYQTGTSIAIDPTGYIYICGNFRNSIDFDPGPAIYYLTPTGMIDIFIQKLDTNGNFVWARSLGGSFDENIKSITLDHLGYIYVTGAFQDTVDFNSGLATENLISEGSNDIFLLKLKQYTNYIQGNVYNDLNSNCSPNPGEQGLFNIFVEAAGDDTSYGTTDSLGNYSIPVDTGTHTVTPILPVSYWQLCNAPQVVHIDTVLTNDTINFGLQSLVDCPLLQVDLQAPFLRKTSQGSYYSISYCNTGTIDAINATVDVELDPFINVLNSSIPITNQTGNTYTFNIGNIAINRCSSFLVQVIVDTSAIGGQTHCSEAHIYPDSVCFPNYWSGPIIDPNATCQNDSIFFTLQNVGSSPFSPTTYYVFEDHVIMRTGNTGTIPSGNSILISVPADTGKTYRISVAQNNGFPPLLGNSIATTAIEGCVPYSDGTFNTIFSNGNSSPFVAIDCQQSIGSYDPNDKSAQPIGYDSQHYIYDYTNLDYKIRFQNTGTDTAFVVIIRDTISQFLDASSIEMGASSHPYTWRLYGQGILEVAFSNISLPDSNVNEPSSHGFISYKIQQKAGNPMGSVIYNSADIYFDYNAAIKTNTTFHTISNNFVTIAVDKIFDKQLDVLVYPNPFTHSTTIEVKGREYEELSLSIYDLAGREIRREQVYYNNKIHVSKGNLPPGIYIYQLKGDKNLINTGKIIAQ